MISSMTKTPQKPLLRGRFHEAAAFVSLGAGAMLVARSHGSRELWASSFYALALFTMLGVSALYHRIPWNSKSRSLMKRFDHATIFGLIAGTSTAIFSLALPEETANMPVMAVWVASFAGMIQVLFWITAPKWISAAIYILTGWLAYPYLAELRGSIGLMGIWLIFSGGVIYSLGALVYAFKIPNPWPKFFGYHEIFHTAVVVAAILHFIVVYQLLG